MIYNWKKEHVFFMQVGRGSANLKLGLNRFWVKLYQYNSLSDFKTFFLYFDSLLSFESYLQVELAREKWKSCPSFLF